MQYDLTIDPELEALCPALSEDERTRLEKIIAADGCRDSIVLWAGHSKTVIDGHNRYRICEKLKKDFKTVALPFKTKDEVKAWMLRNQMGRRNLSESQRGMLAAQLATLGHGQKKADAQSCASATQNEAADEAGVSRRTVQSARKVIEQGAPELQKAVTDGDISVASAAVLAEKPKAEQKKIVAKGEAAVKSAVKKARTAKKKVVGTCPNGECKFVDGVCEKCHDPESATIPEVVPLDTGADFDPANIDAHNKSFAANFAAKVKAHNLEIERFARSIMEAFADPPASVWLDESRLGIALDQIKSACATIRQAKAHDKPCPKCDGKGTVTGKPCKFCKGVGYLPERSYEMAGGQ
jgi:hypothetical protein